ncbi:MAG: SDR family NAD(P)-dependent oxidoreductase [Armatimonadetes bacterium]|nr:SDR family NAD(P)-dependent oxidoreductase [Armatimonadota bacterium]
MDFSGRVVIITGGAGGVGQTVTRRWLAAGASVLVADAAERALDNLRDACAAEAGEAVSRLATVAADVTTEQGAGDIVADAVRAFGRPPDTLLHLVGAFAAGPLGAPDAPAIWNKMLSLNLTSAFHCFRAVLPTLRERGGGWIVALGSRDALAPPARVAAYAAAKAGMVALAQSLSQEVRVEGIHVNLILASTIDTPANRRAMGEDDAPRWVTPDDIADATFYLCSDAARAVHGATLEVYAHA